MKGLGLMAFLASATEAMLPKTKIAPTAPLKGHSIIGKTMQGYMTGQHKPSTRPVYRAKLVDRSKYTPHQGEQECARRVRQWLAPTN